MTGHSMWGLLTPDRFLWTLIYLCHLSRSPCKKPSLPFRMSSISTQHPFSSTTSPLGVSIYHLQVLSEVTSPAQQKRIALKSHLGLTNRIVTIYNTRPNSCTFGLRPTPNTGAADLLKLPRKRAFLIFVAQTGFQRLKPLNRQKGGYLH